VKRATLHVEFTSPAFLGGSTSSEGADAEWRAASVRGQWRWWFRCLAGPAFGNDPQAVAAAERRIFGSSRTASLLQVRAEPTALPTQPVGTRLPDLERRTADQLAAIWSVPPADPVHAATVERLAVFRNGQEVATNTVAYLAYGCMDFRGDLSRSCIAAGSTARIVLQWREDRWAALAPDLQQLTGRSLGAWLLLGGIGSRCRKGFGSLRLDRVEGDLPANFPPLTSPRSEADLQQRLDELRNGATITVPAWTQLTSASRLYRGPATASWQAALDRVASWLIAFRRRYGIPAEARAGLGNRDYEWHKGRGSGADIPDRAGFGLPLPFGQHGPVATASRGAGGPASLRRASPLLLHVERLTRSDGSYVPLLAHLPGAFLPPGAQVDFSGGGVRSRSGPPTPRQLDVVDRFLDDLAGKGLITP
jgi:CRISPR type III-B/RAMP module RAMP protein Cmr1